MLNAHVDDAQVALLMENACCCASAAEADAGAEYRWLLLLRYRLPPLSCQKPRLRWRWLLDGADIDC